MNPKLVQGVGSHRLGHGAAHYVEVVGSALSGEVRVRAGGTLLGTLAVAAGVGTRVNIGQDLPRSTPLTIEINHASDRVMALCAGHGVGGHA